MAEPEGSEVESSCETGGSFPQAVNTGANGFCTSPHAIHVAMLYDRFEHVTYNNLDVLDPLAPRTQDNDPETAVKRHPRN